MIAFHFVVESGSDFATWDFVARRTLDEMALPVHAIIAVTTSCSRIGFTSDERLDFLAHDSFTLFSADGSARFPSFAESLGGIESLNLTGADTFATMNV